MHQRDPRQSSRWAFLGLVLAVATAFGLLAGSAITVNAQNTTGTCTAPASDSTNCTFMTATAVAPGGTLTVALTAPTDATITNITGLPTGCTLTSGAGTAAATVSCTTASAGIPSAAALVEQLSVPSGATGVTQIVTYNANGPQSGTAGVSSSTNFTGTCTAAAAASTVTCTNNPLVTTISGGTLTLSVFNTASPADTVQITAAAPTTYGTCTLTSTTPQPTTPGTNASITYTCAAGQSIPAGTPITVPVAVAGATFPTTPSETTVANANAPISGIAAIPSATVTTATFAVAAVLATPQIVAISPASGAAGSTVTITGTGLNGATAISFGAAAGTNVSCNAAGTQCTVTAPSLPTGTAASVAVTTPGGTSNTNFTFTYSALAPLTVQVSGPTTGVVGQPVTFSATATPSTGATIASYAWSFSDGGTGTGQTVSHTFNSAGPFTATVNVTDTAGASGTASANISITTTPTPGVPVTFQPGWNIVSGPTGTVITGNLGPLYTFQSGNTAYQVIPSGTPLVAGQGYWAFFQSATTDSLPIASPQAITVTMPAGQFIQVGNPTNTTVRISGADAVDTFDPVANTYRTGVTTLSPGQGAWVFSYSGGPLTITP